MKFISTITSVVLVVSAIFGIYYIVVLFSNIDDPSVSGANKTTTESSTSVIVECNDNVTDVEPCFGLVMTTRHEWLAQPSHNPIDKLDQPAKRIILSDTKTEECWNKSKCIYLVRNIQQDHMSSVDDIGYNFLIDTQGDVYEGRGWIKKSALTAVDLKMDSYWVAFIGNFTATPAWDKQVQAVHRFAERAVSVGKLIAAYGVYCSQDILLSPTDVGSKFDDNYKQCLNTY